jgi:V8-like Glu-specific endopeptidase
MKNISAFLLLSFLFLCAGFQARGQTNNTYEINAAEGLNPQNNAPASQCQAVRLSKEWFITAAHCVSSHCRGGCLLQARLFVSLGHGYEMDVQTTVSSLSDSSIKVLTGASQDKVSYDIALIKFPAGKPEAYVYKNLKAGHLVSKEDFLNQIGRSIYDIAVQGRDFPSLFALKGENASVLKGKLSVVPIWDGQSKRYTSFAPVFYSPKKQVLFTSHFGIVKGFSGAGVMTERGELAGIVSATGTLMRGTDKGPSYNFFAAFDDNAVNFIKSNIGGINSNASVAGYFQPIPAEDLEIVASVETAII